MIINKIFFKSFDLNVYLPKLNSLYGVSGDNSNVIFYIYSISDLKLITFYYIINVIVVVFLFACYYNAIYKLPKLVKYNKKQYNDLLFYFWFSFSIFFRFFYNIIYFYNNIFFYKKYFIRNRFFKYYKNSVKLIWNYSNFFFNFVTVLNFFKFNNNFFIFNTIYYKNSIYSVKKNNNF